MAPTVIDTTPQVFLFADGSAGHVITHSDGAPDVDDWDVWFVNSDTTVTIAAAGAPIESAVINQGAYIFARKAVGGESNNVTVTTSGNLNCKVIWRRVAGADAIDISVNATAGTAGTATPALNTGALAEADELIFAFAALHSFGGSVPNTLTWTGGYVGNEVTGGNQGTGGSGVHSSVSYKAPAGTAAETPSCTWNNNASDRYILAVSFTAAAEESVDGTLAASAPAASVSMAGGPVPDGTVALSAPAASVSIAGGPVPDATLAATAPAASVSMAGGVPAEGALAASAPAAAVSMDGESDTLTLGALLAMPTTTVTIYAPGSMPDEWSGERTGDSAVASGVPASIIEQARMVNDPRTGTARVIRYVTGRVPDGTPVAPTSRLVDAEARVYAVSSVRQARNPMWVGDVVLELVRTDQASP